MVFWFIVKTILFFNYRPVDEIMPYSKHPTIKMICLLTNIQDCGRKNRLMILRDYSFFVNIEYDISDFSLTSVLICTHL